MNKWMTILMITTLISCNYNEEDFSIAPNTTGLSSAFVFDRQYLSHGQDSVNFYIDVGIVSLPGQELLNLPNEAFSIKEDASSLVASAIHDVSVQNENPIDNFATLLLIDCSGDYSDFDPFYQSIRVLNEFFQKTNNKNNIASGIAYYGRQGTEADSLGFLVWNGNNPFSNNWEYNITAYFVQSGFHTGGIPNLYDALYKAIDTVAKYTPFSNASITVLTHSFDNVSQHKFNEVIKKANDKNVKINVIAMYSYSINYYKLAHETGGFISLVSEEVDYKYEYMERASSIIKNLDDILLNNLKYYRIYASLYNDDGSKMTSGQWFKWNGTICQLGENNDTVYIQKLPFYLEVP